MNHTAAQYAHPASMFKPPPFSLPSVDATKMYPPLDSEEHNAAFTASTYENPTIFAHFLPSV
jgi:hypothetical protein